MSARDELHAAIVEAMGRLTTFSPGYCANVASVILADPRVLPLIEGVGSEPDQRGAPALPGPGSMYERLVSEERERLAFMAGCERGGDWTAGAVWDPERWADEYLRHAPTVVKEPPRHELEAMVQERARLSPPATTTEAKERPSDGGVTKAVEFANEQARAALRMQAREPRGGASGGWQEAFDGLADALGDLRAAMEEPGGGASAKRSAMWDYDEGFKDGLEVARERLAATRTDEPRGGASGGWQEAFDGLADALADLRAAMKEEPRTSGGVCAPSSEAVHEPGEGA